MNKTLATLVLGLGLGAATALGCGSQATPTPRDMPPLPPNASRFIPTVPLPVTATPYAMKSPLTPTPSPIQLWGGGLMYATPIEGIDSKCLDSKMSALNPPKGIEKIEAVYGASALGGGEIRTLNGISYAGTGPSANLGLELGVQLEQLVAPAVRACYLGK